MYARNTDPQTSHDAANALSEDTLTRLQSAVVAALAAHPHGLTTVEIAAVTGIERDTISPRMPKLVELGIVIDSGQRRVPRGKTRAGIVWKHRPPPVDGGA